MSGKGKTITLKIVYGAAAAILFVLVMAVTFPDRQEELVRTAYPVVILGDSLTGQCRDETSVAAQLEALIGMPVFNGAFGGTCMAMQGEVQDNYTTDLLNMVSLSKAMAADDFGVQQTVRTTRDIMYYFQDTVDELECIDFDRVEVLILAFGINDYHAGIPIDNEKNPLDETSYGGALRSVLTTLQKRYPDMRIILATPTYAWYVSEGLTCEEYDTGAVYLEEYVAKEISIAKEFGVEVVDFYHDVYTHERWEDWKLYTEDGLHPNAKGRALLAGILAKMLQDGGQSE